MPQTDKEWAEYLRKEVATVEGDTEGEHGVADEVLVEFVKVMGYPELAAAWEEVDRWYA